jgi:hypothetical protein
LLGRNGGARRDICCREEGVSEFRIANRGEHSWDIVQESWVDNMGLRAHFANAVPDEGDWHSLLTDILWSNSHAIRYSGNHDYLTDRLEFEIELKWEYGARYNNVGAYIPRAWFEVAWSRLPDPWLVNLRAATYPPYYDGTAEEPRAILPFLVTGEITAGNMFEPVWWEIELYGDGTHGDLRHS